MFRCAWDQCQKDPFLKHFKVKCNVASVACLVLKAHLGSVIWLIKACGFNSNDLIRKGSLHEMTRVCMWNLLLLCCVGATAVGSFISGRTIEHVHCGLQIIAVTLSPSLLWTLFHLPLFNSYYKIKVCIFCICLSSRSRLEWGACWVREGLQCGSSTDTWGCVASGLARACMLGPRGTLCSPLSPYFPWSCMHRH